MEVFARGEFRALLELHCRYGNVPDGLVVQSSVCCRASAVVPKAKRGAIGAVKSGDRRFYLQESRQALVFYRKFRKFEALQADARIAPRSSIGDLEELRKIRQMSR
jgi:hypothetical protein